MNEEAGRAIAVEFREARLATAAHRPSRLPRPTHNVALSLGIPEPRLVALEVGDAVPTEAEAALLVAATTAMRERIALRPKFIQRLLLTNDDRRGRVAAVLAGHGVDLASIDAS